MRVGDKVVIIHKRGHLDPRSYYKQARSLRSAGYEVVLFCLGREDTSEPGMRIVRLPDRRSRWARFLVTNWELFRKSLKESAAVYHFHDLDFVPWAVLLKLFKRTKVVYDIHEAHPEYMMLKSYIPGPLRRILSISVDVMERACIGFFDAITPNDNFIAAGFRHKENIVIFNFPSLDFFRGADSTPWSEREYDLFYHGSLPEYHVQRMMGIAEKLNRTGVKNVWGLVTNDEATVAWARQEMERRHLLGNFHFLPYVDYLSVIQYLNRARIGIIPLPPHPKFKKNIPLKMFEFMGCGLPVVLSDLPPSRQFIEGHGCAIAVEPDNLDQYAKAIEELLGDPARATVMGENGRRLVSERYNWTHEEGKLLALYGRLCGKQRTAAT